MRVLHNVETYRAEIIDETGLLPKEIVGLGRGDVQQQVLKQVQVVVSNLMPGESLTVTRSTDLHAHTQYTLTWTSPHLKLRLRVESGSDDPQARGRSLRCDYRRCMGWTDQGRDQDDHQIDYAQEAMSRIYFHSPERTAEVFGSERAYLGGLTKDFAAGVMAGSAYHRDEIEKRVKGFYGEGVYGRKRVESDYEWEKQFVQWLSISCEGHLVIDGKPIPTFDAVLNTCVASKSPYLALAARIHGTCEIHGYVEAEDCGWFASLLRDALEDNIFRRNPRNQWPETSWEAVADLAAEVHEAGNGPLVMSYSVCESFPSGVEDGEADQLSDEDRWNRGVQVLRSESRRYLRIGPDTLVTHGFQTGKSLFDLKAEIWDLRTFD